MLLEKSNRNRLCGLWNGMMSFTNFGDIINILSGPRKFPRRHRQRYYGGAKKKSWKQSFREDPSDRGARDGKYNSLTFVVDAEQSVRTTTITSTLWPVVTSRRIKIIKSKRKRPRSVVAGRAREIVLLGNYVELKKKKIISRYIQGNC